MKSKHPLLTQKRLARIEIHQSCLFIFGKRSGEEKLTPIRIAAIWPGFQGYFLAIKKPAGAGFSIAKQKAVLLQQRNIRHAQE
jgi:hypothetical protein